MVLPCAPPCIIYGCLSNVCAFVPACFRFRYLSEGFLPLVLLFHLLYPSLAFRRINILFLFVFFFELLSIFFFFPSIPQFFFSFCLCHLTILFLIDTARYRCLLFGAPLPLSVCSSVCFLFSPPISPSSENPRDRQVCPIPSRGARLVHCWMFTLPRSPNPSLSPFCQGCFTFCLTFGHAEHEGFLHWPRCCVEPCLLVFPFLVVFSFVAVPNFYLSRGPFFPFLSLRLLVQVRHSRSLVPPAWALFTKLFSFTPTPPVALFLNPGVHFPRLSAAQQTFKLIPFHGRSFC